MSSHFVSIALDKESKNPIYQQLGDALQDLIHQGILKPNTKLPPIRTLAEQLKINNVTVVNAYKYLENKKVVYSQMGSGTYVSPLPVEEIPSPVFLQHVSAHEKEHHSFAYDTVNFASMSPSTDLFPVEDFKSAFNEILERDKGDAFHYQESQGYYPLRQSLCQYLSTYGIHAVPDKIQIISGAQQGIDILSKAMLRYGDIVFIEKPTYYGAIGAFQSRGGKIIEIPLEEDGMNLSLLENYMKLYHPKLIYTMTYYQTPTGLSYSLEKKRMLLEMAEKYDTFIIEEDYLSDLHYSEKPIIPLKALDHRNRVIYIKSFSKILMPGLRMGFLVLPKSILNHVLSAKHTSDISTSGFIQRALDLYLRKNLRKQHLEKMNAIYRERYKLTVAAIHTHLSPYVSYIPPEGGLSIWLKVQKTIDLQLLYNRLLAHNIIISPGSLFCTDEEPIPYFRLCFAAVSKEDIEPGIRKIKEVLESL